mmetsp:Transcript_36984/g.42182  ORF Transcript_36984/g.42182 Transcript_36984/m.42182 type:complete len:140 (-) Transcript_36984:150-569(-)|eukprot:CAMPEP_0194145586 /NCGR_PEP_ID=MMETSP0152-20130528/17593_1 /TAXON_ID=1049557 /ORGANISM="Thalassiothrix antarctica, Strain L6-D1" /LENGTH=139 /DNA_ID=CAMNT_0038845859 /DNA_START=80 /DNA_END=499 /DNA_ORIENTATION=+
MSLQSNYPSLSIGGSSSFLLCFYSFMILLLSTTVNCQMIAHMGICYSPGASALEVQKHCQSVPDCSNLQEFERKVIDKDEYGILCHLRCEDGLDEDEGYFKCSDFQDIDGQPLQCRQGMVCVIPPVMLDDLEEDSDSDE